jgi:hypothetical protein
MNVNGIGGMAAQILRPQESARPVVDQERAPAAATPAPNLIPTPARVAASGLLAPRQGAIAAEAPAGTDPELWKVLTTEERSYFTRMGSAGPLTYGRQASASRPQAPLVRGGRLDVRV